MVAESGQEVTLRRAGDTRHLVGHQIQTGNILTEALSDYRFEIVKQSQGRPGTVNEGLS